MVSAGKFPCCLNEMQSVWFYVRENLSSSPGKKFDGSDQGVAVGSIGTRLELMGLDPEELFLHNLFAWSFLRSGQFSWVETTLGQNNGHTYYIVLIVVGLDIECSCVYWCTEFYRAYVYDTKLTQLQRIHFGALLTMWFLLTVILLYVKTFFVENCSDPQCGVSRIRLELKNVVPYREMAFLKSVFYWEPTTSTYTIGFKCVHVNNACTIVITIFIFFLISLTS